MRKTFFRLCFELSSHPVLSSMLKAFTTSKASRWLIPSFVRVYNINGQEAEKPLHTYQSLQEVFTRTLTENCRPIDLSPKSIVSPVDGVLAEQGTLSDEANFVVKNQTYTLEEMLGGKEKAKLYREGTYLLFYLSPSHYHRIHSPVNGTIKEQWTLGNKSAPVNNLGLRYGKRPLSRNYRLLTELEAEEGRCIVAKIGALNVNSIVPTHQSEHVDKGEEIGYFAFGSSVMLFFEKGTIQLDDQPRAVEVKMGEKVGSWLR
ncbi:phosphatidylserine decarboxylase [Halalkalibacterium halodurans]|uniref:phosphatidylserine decarboxylase n=1 Tax=Halalkalibacterium halodurans TaxID=86665 RepID=UPI002AA9E796|nr:phosphatidylserine decarboxylase [Halalkalibacterium halodurans]MDY7221838.1 phosphatidylserine decarboxylase [Halalkalibacterium halodurans]MDY7241114.1 phosphatidylserine decarboxylase [Halalkalibacterium halodurans]